MVSDSYCQTVVVEGKEENAPEVDSVDVSLTNPSPGVVDMTASITTGVGNTNRNLDVSVTGDINDSITVDGVEPESTTEVDAQYNVNDQNINVTVSVGGQSDTGSILVELPDNGGGGEEPVDGGGIGIGTKGILGAGAAAIALLRSKKNDN